MPRLKQCAKLAGEEISDSVLTAGFNIFTGNLFELTAIPCK